MRPVDEEMRDLLHAAVTDPPRDVPFDAVVARRARLRRRRLTAAGTAGGVAALVTAASLAVASIAPAARPAGPRKERAVAGWWATGVTCSPRDLTLTLSWQWDRGRLTGTVTASNPTGHECDLRVSPAITPMSPAGEPLQVPFVAPAATSLAPAVLRSGATATASVFWAGWCGPQAGDRARVGWGVGGSAEVTVRGPRQPVCPAAGEPRNMTSGGFGPLDTAARPIDVRTVCERALHGRAAGRVVSAQATTVGEVRRTAGGPADTRPFAGLVTRAGYTEPAAWCWSREDARGGGPARTYTVWLVGPWVTAPTQLTAVARGAGDPVPSGPPVVR